jgi:hypothetical protein
LLASTFLHEALLQQHVFQLHQLAGKRIDAAYDFVLLFDWRERHWNPSDFLTFEEERSMQRNSPSHVTDVEEELEHLMCTGCRYSR